MNSSPNLIDSKTLSSKWICFLIVFTVLVLLCMTIYALSTASIFFLKPKLSFITLTNNQASSTETNELDRPTIWLTWSLYARFCSSWILFVPQAFVAQSGLPGVFSYAFSCFLPFVVLYYLTNLIKKHSINTPTINSILDYFEYRFGLCMRFYACLILVVCMLFNLIGEYTQINAIYTQFTGSKTLGLVIIVIISATTYTYTVLGGIRASVLTDEVQGIFSAILVILIMIYLLLNINSVLVNISVSYKTAASNTDLDDLNRKGLRTFMSIPISMVCATIFSGSCWQRVFLANSNPTKLKKACYTSSILIFITILFMGSIGYLALKTKLQGDDTNTILFTFLSNLNIEFRPFLTTSLLIFTCVLSQPTIDSYQNAIYYYLTNAIKEPNFNQTGQTREGVEQNRRIMILLYKSLVYIILLSFNISALYFATNNTNVIKYVKFENLFRTVSTPLFLLSLVVYLNKYLTQMCAIFGCLFALFVLVIYGYLEKNDFSEGFKYVFLGDYLDFSLLLGVSAPTIGMAIYALVRVLLERLKLNYNTASI